MSEGKQCARPGCGDIEFRIDGYCSIYCRDIHDEQKLADWRIAQARRDERERCAKIADSVSAPFVPSGKWGEGAAFNANKIAAAIRALGDE